VPCPANVALLPIPRDQASIALPAVNRSTSKPVKTFSLLIAFVEGVMTPIAFLDWLYNDAQAETLLSAEDNIPPYTRDASNLYHYLIERDFRRPDDLLNAQHAISLFLTKRSVPYTSTQTYAEAHDTLLNALPRWLNLPPAYAQELLAEVGGANRKEKAAWLKTQIAERFKYLKAPPKWLQSPDWQFSDNRPLIFVGQLDIAGLSHDTAALYIFFDPVLRQYAFTQQSM
jgi:hypothetical protein